MYEDTLKTKELFHTIDNNKINNNLINLYKKIKISNNNETI